VPSPADMAVSKFVELFDGAPAYVDQNDIHVDTSARGRTSSDSSASPKSADSPSLPGQIVYRDRFPSPKRSSTDSSPTESPTRRRLRKLSLRKDS
jgi:hypothetical protein